MKQQYDNQTLANTSNGDNTTRSAHQLMGHERSDTPPILGGLKRLSHLGQIPTTNSPFFCSFGNNGYNTPEKTRLHGHSRHNKTTTHHKRTQPRCNKPTSTSGPLTRRRVIIHVEDHTHKANRQAINKQTTPRTSRLTTTCMPYMIKIP